ncbi:MAG: hypothetical protein ACYCQJ_10390 [Nitrososphaerales archaeon]
MADYALVILLFWHIGSVIVWLGTILFFVSVLSPSIREVDHDKKRAILRTMLPRISKTIGGASASTLLAGIVLFGYVGSVPGLIPTGLRLIFITIGATLGLFAVILTLGVIVPLSSKFMRQSESQANASTAEIETFQAISSVARALLFLMITIVTLMTFGVYF